MAERVLPGKTPARLIADRYAIEEILGRGGMAKVYRVRDTRTQRSVALKRGWARNGKKAEKRRALLEREFHTLTQLAHPRIIEVYDYGIDEDGPFYTMELLDGADLDRGGRLPWQVACALLRDVASSLAILHARGLIHRDVSSRNVRCTADGRAKLIDFGAMTSMGVAKDIVGTPPFMAPEVMQMQALDARADLFSLGALAYYLLTGRHAFPARKLAELRDVWRSRPISPHKLVPELPPALAALTMQLLMLDRNARPQSAAEVMERLCAIAGLSLEERVEVSRAYLATPTLVGRDEESIELRRRMLPLARGDGGTLVIAGAAGSGRSRLLDATALEGKLLGATVLRADAGDGSRGDWGAARALCTQLVELMPREANDAARLSIDVLGHVLDGLRGDASVSAVWPERSLLLRELRDFVLSLARGRRVLIVVDDVDRIDEPSAALLAALSHKTDRHSLMLVIALDLQSESANGVSLHALRNGAHTIELGPLTADQTVALVRSLFGDVPNLHLCAGRIHALSQGNPRTTMALAQHLVSQGLARYEAGSWSLPGAIEERDLPSTLAASLAVRLSLLSKQACELAYALCLAEGESLIQDSYTELTSYGDHKQVFRALDELLAARVLIAEGERYRISQQGFQAALFEVLPEAERLACHSRMAELLARSGGDVLRRAHHLLTAGRDIEAVDLLCSINLRARLPPLPLLERALERAERYALPARVIHSLRLAVLNKAPMVLGVESFRRCLPPVLAQLERESGLLTLRELGHLPENERLAQALAICQKRYLDTPAQERGNSPSDALAELTKLAGACYSFASQSLDPGFFDLLPSLAPLTPLSASLKVVEEMGVHVKDWMAGRRMRSNRQVKAILRRMAEPDRAGLDEMQHNRARLSLVYTLGLLEASIGSAEAEQYAHVMEGDRELRVSAWRVRLLLHLNQGNLTEARKCSRRAELVQLQDGSGQQRYLNNSAGLELISYCQAGDLLGVKNAIEKVTLMAARCPGWQPLMSYGLCYQLWLRDDPKGALESLLPALAQVRAGEHAYFSMMAALHVALLGALGRDEDACVLGLRYLEDCRREHLAPDERFVQVEVAQVLARVGQHDRALSLIQQVIAEGERLGMAGLSLGMLYEARARIALCMRDYAAFQQFSDLCAHEYTKGKNPALSQKFGRLMEEARQLRGELSEPTLEAKQLLEVGQPESEYDTVHSRMLECVDGGDRARCALTILLQTTDSCAGYLYGVIDGRVELLAALPDIPPEPALDRWVQDYLQAEQDAAVTATASESQEPESKHETMNRYADVDDRHFEAVLLIAEQERQTAVVGVLALQVTARPRSLPSRALLASVADQLLGHGDVRVTLLSAAETVER